MKAELKSLNKPDTTLQTEKLAESTLNQKKGKEVAENEGESDSGVMYWLKQVESNRNQVGVKPATSEQIKKTLPNPHESKPKELSPFLKARQNLKNGIK